MDRLLLSVNGGGSFLYRLVVSTNWEVPFVGVLEARSLLNGVYTRAPDCWKLACSCMVCTWALKGLPYYSFGSYVCAEMLLGSPGLGAHPRLR